MEYMYNDEYGVLIYPNNWWDVFRLKIIKLLLPSFERTWKKNPYWYRTSVHTIEHKLRKTDYPSIAGC